MAAVGLIRFLDRYLGGFICIILSFFNFKPGKPAYKRILLIQFWGIGETILTLPAINELRKKYKGSEIDVLTTKRVDEVFFNNKNISNIRLVDLNPISIKLFILANFRKYDLVIDMEEYLNISSIISFFVGKVRVGYGHALRSRLYTEKVEYNDRQHVSQTYMDLLKPLGIKVKVTGLEKLAYLQEDRENLESILRKNGISERFIVFSPGVAESSRFRMWPQERWAELLKQVNAKYKKTNVVFVGNSDMKESIEKIILNAGSPKNAFNLAGKTSLTGLFVLMEKAGLVVSIDSGPMHIAAAQGVRTIGLFGPNTPVRFAPLNKRSVSIYRPVAPPVINVHKGEVPTHSDIDFMGSIQVEDVMEAVGKLMGKR